MCNNPGRFVQNRQNTWYTSSMQHNSTWQNVAGYRHPDPRKPLRAMPAESEKNIARASTHAAQKWIPNNKWLLCTAVMFNSLSIALKQYYGRELFSIAISHTQIQKKKRHLHHEVYKVSQNFTEGNTSKVSACLLLFACLRCFCQQMFRNVLKFVKPLQSCWETC